MPFILENNRIVTFKFSFRPDFQDEYVLMFAGMFMQVLLLFPTIPKLFAFFIKAYRCCRNGHTS